MESNTVNKIKCLFGFHNYTIPHKRWRTILICDRCLRFGYRPRKEHTVPALYEFDEHGNKIYFKMLCDDGHEHWYDNQGNIIYEKFNT